MSNLVPHSDLTSKVDSHKIIVGRFGAPYGIKGWLKLHSFTDPIDNILNYQPWSIDYRHHSISLEDVTGKEHSEGLIVKLPGIDDRDLAKTYTNKFISIERQQLAQLKTGEFYWSDLIGLTVINREGILLGQIENLLPTGSNDVLVIKGDKEHLIPYMPGHFVQKIDLNARVVYVDWDAAF